MLKSVVHEKWNNFSSPGNIKSFPTRNKVLCYILGMMQSTVGIELFETIEIKIISRKNLLVT